MSREVHCRGDFLKIKLYVAVSVFLYLVSDIQTTCTCSRFRFPIFLNDSLSCISLQLATEVFLVKNRNILAGFRLMISSFCKNLKWNLFCSKSFLKVLPRFWLPWIQLTTGFPPIGGFFFHQLVDLHQSWHQLKNFEKQRKGLRTVALNFWLVKAGHCYFRLFVP